MELRNKTTDELTTLATELKDLYWKVKPVTIKVTLEPEDIAFNKTLRGKISSKTVEREELKNQLVGMQIALKTVPDAAKGSVEKVIKETEKEIESLGKTITDLESKIRQSETTKNVVGNDVLEAALETLREKVGLLDIVLMTTSKANNIVNQAIKNNGETPINLMVRTSVIDTDE